VRDPDRKIFTSNTKVSYTWCVVYIYICMLRLATSGRQFPFERARKNNHFYASKYIKRSGEIYSCVPMTSAASLVLVTDIRFYFIRQQPCVRFLTCVYVYKPPSSRSERRKKHTRALRNNI